jgi:hypothetical protein
MICWDFADITLFVGFEYEWHILGVRQCVLKMAVYENGSYF